MNNHPLNHQPRRDQTPDSRNRQNGKGDGHKAGGSTRQAKNSAYHFVALVGHGGLVCFDKIKSLGQGLWTSLVKQDGGKNRAYPIIVSAFTVLMISLSLVYYAMGMKALPVGFLKPQIAAELSTNFNGGAVSIDEAYLQRDRERGGFFIRLTNMVLREQGGGVVAASPEMAIGLKFWPLLIGKVAPDSLSLIEPEVHLVRNSEGAWSFWRSQDNSASLGHQPVQKSNSSPLTAHQLANLGDFVAQGLEGAHRQLQRSKELSFIGLRGAKLVLHTKVDQTNTNKGRTNEVEVWSMPSFTLQYDQDDENRLIGSGVLIPENAPTSEIFLAMTHRQGDHYFDVKSKLRNIVPSKLTRFIPALSSLVAVNLGVTGEFKGRVDLREGLHSGRLKVALSAGEIGVFGANGPNFEISAGQFEFAMEAGAKHVIMHHGELQYPSGHVSLRGDIWRESNEVGPGDWRFQLYSTAGKIMSSDQEVNGKNIDEFSFAGRLFATKNPVSIDELRVEIDKSRLLIAHDGSGGFPAILRGQMQNFSLPLVRTVWPLGFLTDLRHWVFENVKSGTISNGNFSLATWGESQTPEKAKIQNQQHSKQALPRLDLKIKNLSYSLAEGPLLIEPGELVVALNGKTLKAKFAKGEVVVPRSGRVKLSKGQFTVPNIELGTPTGAYRFNIDSDANTLLALLKQKPIEYDLPLAKDLKKLKGKVRGEVTLTMPLKEKPSANEIKFDGDVKVQKASLQVGKYSLTNGAVTIHLGRKHIETRGNVLINGTAASLKWAQAIKPKRGQQPAPLVISGVFDDADRNQLGLAVNNFIEGPVPVEITLTPRGGDKQDIHISADLTKANLTSHGLGWRKAAGRRSQLDFDVEKQANQDTLLTNFHIEGDDLTARGEIVIDKNGSLQRFSFPAISYKVVSNIALNGKRVRVSKTANKHLWQVKAKGKTYDGRGFLRALLHTGRVGGGNQSAFKTADGLDITANFKTVLGWHQSRLSNVKLAMQRRGDELKAFKFNGRLPHNGEITGTLQSRKGRDPIIEIQTQDAGEALRFVGFYPNMLGGWGRLRVRYNVRKRQLASQTGRLLIKKFSLASDPVVKEVLANLNQGKKGETKNEQNKVKFSRLDAPFSIGHEQFVLHDSYIKGDVLGATMRGQMDFRHNKVRLAGTYIPLYGLNAAVGAVPVLGDILVGRRGEGMLGITFGIYGDINKPEVLVNPMSLVAPGVFRQIFEFQQQTPKIQARSKTNSDGKVKLDASSSKVQRLKNGKTPENRRTPETSSSVQRK